VRDEAAFESLVRRHGPLVWGVCLRLLDDPSDAEDAFQATFFVLARKAAAIRQRELLANWLYGVARRTARKARSLRGRRRGHERQVATMPEPNLPRKHIWAEVSPILDAELARLAEKYRQPILLCYLEGLTRREAAAALGWPPGTVAGRLARALNLLRTRLSRRGLILPAGVLAVALAERASAAVPPALLVSVTRAAPRVAAEGLTAGAVSAAVAALTKGTLQAMNTAKIVRTVAPLLVFGLLLASGAAVLSNVPAGAEPAPSPSFASAAAVPGVAADATPVPVQGKDKGQPPVKGNESRRLTPEQALALIREYLQDDVRARTVLDKLKVKERTTAPLWDKLEAQMFQLDLKEGVPFMDTYIIRNKAVIPINAALPGFYLTSYCVADLRRDGKPLLAYSYFLGSGRVRSEVAVLDLRARKPASVVAAQALVLDAAHHWHVKAVDDHTVRVEGGSVDFGELVLQEKDGKPVLRIKLRDDLPEKIRKNIDQTNAPDNGPANVKKLIEQLGDADFKTREEATRRLLEAGEAVLPALRDALQTAQPETRRRLEAVIAGLEKQKKK
jgi:RNA polymerase sigma factor (sigma-70 family)